MTDETPAKYQAKPRKHEQKDWLYEQYWGQLRSMRDIADEFDIDASAIRKGLRMHGIPSRPNRWTMDNTVSAFTGFYDDEAAPTDEASMDFDGINESNDEWKKPDGRLNWQRVARSNESISEKALLGD